MNIPIWFWIPAIGMMAWGIIVAGNVLASHRNRIRRLEINSDKIATMERLLTDRASDCMACEKRIKELEVTSQHLWELAEEHAGYLDDLIKNQHPGDPLVTGFPAVLPPTLCTSCGHQFEPGAKYCRRCGTSANKYQLIDNVKTGHKYKQAKEREDNGWPSRNDQKAILMIVREADLKRQESELDLKQRATARVLQLVEDAEAQREAEVKQRMEGQRIIESQVPLKPLKNSSPIPWKDFSNTV